MPGVVSDEDHLRALAVFPDPRLVLGDIYAGKGNGVGGLWEKSEAAKNTAAPTGRL